MMKEEVTFVGAPMLSREAAIAVMRAFLVPEDMGTPTGAIALRGATNFQTPPGWDTVYTPILNMIERPVAPMLSVRVETDWYAHETEFRYVLQPGEGITLEHSIPIGQVFFVPREQITMRQCTERGTEGHRGITRRVQSPQGRCHAADVVRPELQPALSETDPRPEGLRRTRIINVSMRLIGRDFVLVLRAFETQQVQPDTNSTP